MSSDILFAMGLGNSMTPNRHQPSTWTNADLPTDGLLGTNVIEIWKYRSNFYPAALKDPGVLSLQSRQASG